MRGANRTLGPSRKNTFVTPDNTVQEAGGGFMSLRGKVLPPLALVFAAAALTLVLWVHLAKGSALAAILVLTAIGVCVLALLEFRVFRPLRALRQAAASANPAADLSAPDEIAAARVAIAGLSREAETREQQHGREITARQQAERALEETEERYALATSAVDGLWEWDIKDGSMQLSPSWKAMLGFAPQEFSDSYAAWKNRIHLADVAKVETALKAHLSGASARFESEHRLLHKDTSHRWVLSRATGIVRDAESNVQRVIGLDIDITPFKRREEVLAQLAESTSGATGETFFRELTRNVATAVGVRVAVLTQCVDFPTTRLRTLAFWSGGEFLANLEYDLAGTPCETVIKQGVERFYASNVRREFPADEQLAAESYYGTPLINAEGAVVGHLALLDDKPMDASVALTSIYRIFTARAAAELARNHTEHSIAALVNELETLGREERLRHIARRFAELIGAREAIVTECVQVPHKRLRVLAWWRDGRFEPYTEYNLVGTTCEETVNEGRICFYRSGVGERFPPARPFERECYLGVPCFDANKDVIGHVAAFHNKPMQKDLPGASVLQLFADRAAFELREVRAAKQ
jgi:PAS domain S-box-containing protein